MRRVGSIIVILFRQKYYRPTELRPEKDIMVPNDILKTQLAEAGGDVSEHQISPFREQNNRNNMRQQPEITTQHTFHCRNYPARTERSSIVGYYMCLRKKLS